MQGSLVYINIKLITLLRLTNKKTSSSDFLNFFRCRTSQDGKTFIPLSVYLQNDLIGPVFDGVGLAGFKFKANVFLLA